MGPNLRVPIREFPTTTQRPGIDMTTSANEESGRSDAAIALPPGGKPDSSEAPTTDGASAPAVPTTHPIGFWFFFWGELAERCSYYGMRAILAFYMADQLGFARSDAKLAMHTFIAACYLLPLLGGWIADR